jgi:hypothetical protein
MGWSKIPQVIKAIKPGTKFSGQKTKESFIEAGKKFKKKMADDAKKAKEEEFKKKPWKRHGMSKKEYDDLPF